jgi:hypothetical protein
MNLLTSIIDRLNQRAAVGNIFDQIYGLCELYDGGSERAWVHYIGNGQAVPVTNYDAKQGTLFWAKRGKTTVTKTDSLRVAGCKTMYETRFPLTAYAVVRKNHLPCDSAEAQDWIASRVYKLVSGTDPQFKTALGVVNYEVTPNGYTNEIKQLPPQFEWASVTIEMDVIVTTFNEDGCYDTCATGDIPLPDFEPCTPCLTSVAVDGVTIIGNGTPEDPLTAIGGGGGTPLTVKDEGTNVSTNTATLNFTGAGVTASLTSPGVVEVNIPSGGGGGGVTAVTGSAPIASSGGATPDISITQANGSTDGYLSSSDFNTFSGKQDALTAGTGIDLTGNIVTNTAPDQIVSITGGTDITVTGTYPSFTIDSTAATGMQGGQATGTDTYAVSIPGVTGYTLNDAYAIGFTNANTGASTLNINGLGAVNIAKNNTVPIIGGDIAANQQFIAIYDGTNFQLLGVAPNQMFAYVTNADSVTINRGQPVYAFGATGDRMTVKLANNTSEATSAKTVGLVFSTSIAPNQKGYIITQGVIDGINTNAYSAGDTLYVGNSAGALTNVKPYAPNHYTRIGIVERANAGNGQIYVFVQNGAELEELSDVDIVTTPPVNNDFLVYTTGVNNLWKNRSLGNVLGGTTSQYVRGDGSLATFPTIPTGTVTSVSATVPSPTSPALSVTVSNPTTTPAIAITANGSTSQYIRGDGSLQTFPTIPAASVVYKSAISSATHTGTANTVKYTQLIPANTFVAGDVVRITYRTAKTGTANSMTLRIYANTTPDLSGSPILLGSHQNLGATSFLVNQMIRHLAIKTANNNTEVYFAPGLGVATDYGLYDLTSTAAVNWTIQQYIVFALQLNTTGTDVTFGSLYMIEKP